VLMICFIVLAFTGLTQKYADAGWAQWIILHLGGIQYTRLIHRSFAVILMAGTVYHIGYQAYRIFIRHAKLTMLPTLKDFRDIIQDIRHIFGLSDKEPHFGRFDYKQKFEYWGLIFGNTIIILTGLVMAFPVVFTRIFPGQLVAAAVTMHGMEATLALLTIIIWHLYDTVLKPGVFPVDTTIFTGKISKERMLEEHPLEYSEIVSNDYDGK
jgi:formate dehydrogenase subunit gamma